MNHWLFLYSIHMEEFEPGGEMKFELVWRVVAIANFLGFGTVSLCLWAQAPFS